MTNGCTATASVEVEEDSNPPNVDPGLSDTLSCTDPFILLDGGNSSGNNLAFTWKDPVNAVISNMDTVTVGQPGTYTLVVIDQNNNCVDSATVDVNQNADIPISDPGNNATITCTNPDITLDGSGSSSGQGIVYIWQNSNGTPISDSTITQVSDPDTYTLFVIDNTNGCSSSARCSY